MEVKTLAFELAGGTKEDQAAATSSAAEGKKRERSSTPEIGVNSPNGRIIDSSFRGSIEKTDSISHTTQQCLKVYAPLDPEGDEIRLVRLFPGRDTQPIKCELIPVKNEDLSGYPYEALSYTWGSSEKTDSIILDNSKFGVTTNLWSALKHLRLQNATRTLWIDAICINQENVHERNSQVQKMSTIYRQAKTVIVWLGEAGENSSAAFEFLRMVTEAPEYDRVGPDQWIYSSRWTHKFSALTALSSRDYWRRIWIIQEILCSTEAILHCGHDSIPMSKFTDFRRHCATTKNFGLFYDDLEEFKATPAAQIDRQRDSMASGISLLQLLETSKFSYSTEKKDRIFALLGLANDSFLFESAEDRLLVDYGMSVFELYHQTVRLHAAEHRVRVCQLLQCVLEPLEQGVSVNGRDFGTLPADLRLLDATGYSVGTIEMVIAHSNELSAQRWKSAELQMESSRLLDLVESKSRRHKVQARFLVRMMECVGDAGRAKLTTVIVRTISGKNSRFLQLGSTNIPNRMREEPGKSLMREGEAQQTSLGEFKLFVTKSGLVGCGPTSIQPGDVLYMFRGSNVVLVLSQSWPVSGNLAVQRCFATSPGRYIVNLWPRLPPILDPASHHAEYIERRTTWMPKELSGEAMTFGLSASSWEMLTR